ncbi:MAG: sce7725 family protein [Leuconostoc mesenteroides]
MYYPLLRGKQNELLALRELLKNGKLSKKIIPIIEPIKASATFRLLLRSFFQGKRNIAVIQNTAVTNYVGFNTAEIDSIKAANNFIPSFIIRSDSDLVLLNEPNPRKIAVLNIKSEITKIDSLRMQGIYVVVDTDNKRMERKVKDANISNLIELNDSFIKLPRNQDYLNDPDEFFSQEHKFYKQDGFSGFSDYSIIGSDYVDTGFAAKAVAIHIVYFDANGDLRVHHFVSNSNDDITNPAGKFAEALKKLIEWKNGPQFDGLQNQSEALEEFQKMYDTGRYSGLGVIKKLSLKHHLEIMGRFLETHEEREL